MFVMLFIYRRIVTGGSYVTITGKAFRPRVADVRALRWVLFAVCVLYLLASVVLPLLTLDVMRRCRRSPSLSPPPTTSRSTISAAP